MKRIYFLLFAFVIFNVQGQNSLSKFKLLNHLSVGVGYGLNQFSGDIDNSKNLDRAVSLQFFIPLEKKGFMLSSELNMGYLSAENNFPSTLFIENLGDPLFVDVTGERFLMEYLELDFNFLISVKNLMNDIIYQRMGSRLKAESQKFDFMFKLGLGLNMFRSLRTELYTEKFINSYGYNWAWQNNFENAGQKKQDRVSEGVLVLGIISRYELAPLWSIDIAATSRIGDTDKWDSKLNSGNDIFTQYTVSVVYKLKTNF